MQKSILFLIAVLISLHCFSQESIYRLHPLVGDTIDQKEKFNYLLFKQINDADFNFGILTHSNDAYFLKVFSPSNSISTVEIDTTELKQYIAKLDILQEYFANEGKIDSTTINLNPDEEISDYSLKKLNSSLINEKSKSKIMKEARTGTRLKGDAERYKNRKDHSNMFSGAGYVEFPVIKTKKRK